MLSLSHQLVFTLAGAMVKLLFWDNRDVMFDWTAEITGTRDRSEFKLETILESTI